MFLEYAKLLVEYESLKRENEQINEQYITAELENFEITSYCEQILAEEKLKTAQYEFEYIQKIQDLSSPDKTISRTPTPPPIPDDDDD